MWRFPESAGGPTPAVLFCHGFTGHRIEAHCLFVKTARALALAGITSLRFDFRGSGESDGEFRDMTVSREIQDAAAALEVMASDRRVDPRRLGAVGLSLGGCVAACLAGREQRLRSVALWGAVARPAVLFSEPPRQAWADLVRRHGHLDVGAYDVGRAFIEDLPNHDPVGALAAATAHALIVHGGADASVPPTDADLYVGARAGGALTEKHVTPDADHTFSTLAWEREAIARTIEWFRRTLT
jgi:dipeptidyl aminopeptidase/acylaminoacyl peptidase